MTRFLVRLFFEAICLQTPFITDKHDQPIVENEDQQNLRTLKLDLPSRQLTRTQIASSMIIVPRKGALLKI